MNNGVFKGDEMFCFYPGALKKITPYQLESVGAKLFYLPGRIRASVSFLTNGTI